jgi:hypothetical protein
MTPNLSAVIASAAEPKKMRLRTDLTERGWTFWELRNLNMHRVVGFRRTGDSVDARTLDAELRGTLARNFKRAWWRGIAYGVVADVGNMTFTTDELKILVDERENTNGTMQWVVLLSGTDSRTATGVHTWIEGFLSPVYRSILETLSQNGYTIESVMKEKDGLMRFLTAVADARARGLYGHEQFPEFRDPFLKK